MGGLCRMHGWTASTEAGKTHGHTGTPQHAPQHVPQHAQPSSTAATKAVHPFMSGEMLRCLGSRQQELRARSRQGRPPPSVARTGLISAWNETQAPNTSNIQAAQLFAVAPALTFDLGRLSCGADRFGRGNRNAVLGHSCLGTRRPTRAASCLTCSCCQLHWCDRRCHRRCRCGAVNRAA